MTRDDIDQICATLPGATWADPSEGALPSWKVGGKMFVSVAHDGSGISVKCQDIETAQMLIELGSAHRAPYFHRSWVRLPLQGLPQDDAQHRITASYQIIRAGLSKKRQAALG